jgi:hypothetical protein
MGTKANRIVYAALVSALDEIGIVKVAELFAEAVDDNGSLEDGLDDVSAKREKQFRDGIAKVIKARKGAERDEREDSDECDCVINECCRRCSSYVDHFPAEEKRISESVKDFLIRMQHWTGLHFSVNMALAEIMHVDYSVKKLKKKMRKCQCVEELATLLSKKAGARVIVRESVRGKILPGAIRLTASSSAYVICLA